MDSRRMMMQSKKSILPKEYQQVEYLEATGTQYLTLKKGVTSFYCEMSFLYVNRSGFITQRFNESGNTLLIAINNRLGSGWTEIPYIFDGLDKYSIIEHYNKGSIIIDGVEKKESHIYVSLGDTLNIFAYCTGVSANGKGRLRFIETNIYRCYPCYAKEPVINFEGKLVPDGTAGVFDVIENVFYTNKGTGTFKVGPDVN